MENLNGRILIAFFGLLGFGFVAGSEKPVVIRSVIPSKTRGNRSIFPAEHVIW